MRIGIVGDLHIAPTPGKRIDNYFETGLNKIEQISKECDYVIFLGDIFTNPKVEEKYVYALINHLQYCYNAYRTRFATIVGNHDVVSEDENNLANSSLGILSISNALHVILPDNPLIIDNYSFATIPVKFKAAQQYLPNIKPMNGYHNVLLVHHEYGVGTASFTYEDFKDLGFNSVFLGHDHKPFDEGRIIYPEFTAYRSGSMMRNRADDYNFTRCLYYFVIDTTNNENPVSCKVVQCQEAQKVFKIEALTKQDYKKEKFVQSLNEVIDKYKNNISVQTRFSIKNILQELGAPEKVIEGVRKKYDAIQETFY